MMTPPAKHLTTTPKVGDTIHVRHGRLRGHSGYVLYVNAHAIGFRDVSHAGEPLRWIGCERIARGDVEIEVTP